MEKIAERIDTENARPLVAQFDAILDGSDNFATRYAVSDACFYEKRPLVTAAIGEFDGTLTTLKPYALNARGAQKSELSLPVSRSAAAGNRPSLADAGVLGALGGVFGS